MRIALQGPVGRLAGILEEPEGVAPRGAALVCHPHPAHGGTLRNTLVVRCARALRAAGMATLRFNFRGVEGSEGRHDGEGAEEGDAAAGLDWLAARYPGLPLWGAGFSFGARTIAGLAARDPRLERLVLIAFPVGVYDASVLGALTQPGLLIFGGGDRFGTLTELAAAVPELPERLEAEQLEGADHFFRGRTPVVEERIREYALGVWEAAR